MLSTLFCGTPSGVWAVSGAGQQASQQAARQAGLPGALITHLAASAGGTVAAAVPRIGPVHGMYDCLASAQQQDSGLHLLQPRGGDTQLQASKVWAGDARACCCWDAPGGAVGLAVGTEPADVFASADGGQTWSEGTASFAGAASRASWSFPAPPHEPHVLSLERLAGGALAAGIEVGGVLVGAAAGAGGWEERSEGLYPDVHSCRIDPHDPQHWLAVTGKGLYASHDGGASWAAQGEWHGRYTVGLAFNPQHQGEVLVAAGNRPPARGVHVHHSTDGGATWSDVTEAVFGGECAEARGSRTPVPYFFGSQALLGSDSGHLVAAADAERRRWRVACRLPHPILCMAGPGQSPSSVMH